MSCIECVGDYQFKVLSTKGLKGVGVIPLFPFANCVRVACLNKQRITPNRGHRNNQKCNDLH